MTEEYMNFIKNNYEPWCKEEDEWIRKYNERVRKYIEDQKRAKELLKDKNVQEFADLIDYKFEPKEIRHYSDEEKFLRFLQYHSLILDSFALNAKKDPYRILVYTETRSSLFGHGAVDDVYCYLENPCALEIVTDTRFRKHSRLKFLEKNRDRIIYPEEGESFKDIKYFYKVQEEYLKCAFESDQDKAFKLVLNRYGRK